MLYGVSHGFDSSHIDLNCGCHRHDLRTWREQLKKELCIDNPTTAMQPSHIFMLNLAYEWMLLLLLRPFYEPNAQKLALVTGGRPVRREEDLRKLFRLANQECPKSAARVLDLLSAYDKLFTLRLCPVTNIQIAYLAGKTLLRTVIAGGPVPGNSENSKKAVAAGLKARDRVRECARHLRAIGETWISGILTADMLEKELDGEIERQQQTRRASSRSPSRSPRNQPASIPLSQQGSPTGAQAKAKAKKTPGSPPKQSLPAHANMVPIVSSRLVPPTEYLGAPNAVATSSGVAHVPGGSPASPNKGVKRRMSPSIPNPEPVSKRSMTRRQTDLLRRQQHPGPSSQGMHSRTINLSIHSVLWMLIYVPPYDHCLAYIATDVIIPEATVMPSASLSPTQSIGDPAFDLFASMGMSPADTFSSGISGVSPTSPLVASAMPWSGASQPIYFSPPQGPPPQFPVNYSQHNSSHQHRQQLVSQYNPVLRPVPRRPQHEQRMTGLPAETSMNHWFEVGHNFSGAPSSEAPLLPFAPAPNALFPFEFDGDMDESQGADA